MTWDRWATLGFAAVAAIGAVIAGYVNLAKHFRERNQAKAEERRRWSLEVEPPSQGEWRFAHLRRRELGAISISLRTLRVRAPSNALLATVSHDKRTGLVGYGGSYAPIPDLATAARTLVVEANLHPARAWTFDRRTTVALDYSLFDFFVLSPPASSFWRRHSSRRLTITVEAEEISSARRAIRINVKSHPID